MRGSLESRFSLSTGQCISFDARQASFVVSCITVVVSLFFLIFLFFIYIYIVSADTICVAQVPGIQGGSTGARSSRYRLCGV